MTPAAAGRDHPGEFASGIADSPAGRRFACADRYCVSGLRVTREGDVCPACRPVYQGIHAAADDAHCQALARQGTERSQMAGGY